ncbi:MAG: hypothetical protein GC201_01485 [Alphaproteobacteria bacterium]|nr:hypothetical protein [Alphaproteobacteria bacterium]
MEQTLGELGTWSGGGTPSKANKTYWQNGTVPWVSPKDMKSRRIRTAEDLITDAAVAGSSAKYIPSNSILMVTRSGILAHTFPVAVNECRVTVNQDLKTLTPSACITADYVAWYLRAKNAQILKQCAKHGTTVASIDSDRLKKFPVPVAPLNEQGRIVEKIETLFAQLDKGEEALRDVQTLLARYRQSVLKAAVTGQLTADWRAENAQRLEHGRDLLARILKTRRETWEGRGKYKEPIAADVSNLPNLPNGWAWATLGQLLSKIEAGKNFRCEERPPGRDEAGIVKISAVTWDTFNENESKTILNEEKISPSLNIMPGDLLISRANTIELVGASVVVDDIKKSLQISDKVLRLRSVAPIEHWINYVLKSSLGRGQIEAMATGAQMSMRNISQKNLEKIAIPLPPPEEIDVALAHIRRTREEGSRILDSCRTELTRSAALRQSILKDAFAGRLVPQDPVDEPASELLARIRAEASSTKKTRGKAVA